MFDDLLSLVRKPSRYLGCEIHAVRPARPDQDLRVALAFPDLYEIGMSHLGSAILYHTLNRLPGVGAERVYMPDRDLEARLRERAVPLSTLETRTPLNRLDILGFTLAYELTFTNVLAMLDLGGIPLHARERKSSHPLVLAGGPCAFNPEPMSAFFDAFVIGEAEYCLPRVCRFLTSWKAARGDRDSLLKALAAMEGLYVPSQYKWEPAPGRGRGHLVPHPGRRAPVTKCLVPDLDESPYPACPPVPFARVVHDRVSIEATRGCPHGCRFCQASVLYRPYRERSPDRILGLASETLKNTGYADLSLMALSIGDYSQLLPLAARLMKRFEPQGVALSLPSIRVGSLESSVVEEILKVRKTGLTLAPEAASARLRGVINKDIQEEEIFRTARLLARLGWRSLKLYFMIGLPTEEDGDIEAMVRLARETLKNARVHKGGGFQLTVNVSTFVPKPHTPFQWDAQVGRPEAERKQNFLKKKLQGAGFRLKWHDSRMSLLEGILARGDRSLASLVECAFRLGCRLDGWSEHFDFGLWEQAFDSCSLSPEERLNPCPDFADPLPWDWIGTGVSKASLVRERRRASLGELTPIRCSGHCAECGLCDEIPQRDPPPPEYTLQVCKPCPAAQEPPAPDTREEAAAMPASPGAGLSGPAAQEPQDTREEASSGPPSGAGLPAPAPDPRAAAASPAIPAAKAPLARIRLGYRKRKPAAWLSHLETLNALQRALRRSGLPIAFTAGEHPHPRISFSPALSVGVESLAEYLDLWFLLPVSVGDTADAINARLPEGFSVFAAEPVPLHAPSLEQSISWMDYEVCFADRENPPGTHELLALAVRGEPPPQADSMRAGPPGLDLRGDPPESLPNPSGEAPEPPVKPSAFHDAELDRLAGASRLRFRILRACGSMPSPGRTLEGFLAGFFPAGFRARILKVRAGFAEPFHVVLGQKSLVLPEPRKKPARLPLTEKLGESGHGE